MPSRITLRVLGVDLEDESTVERIASQLDGDNVAWLGVDGVVFVTLFINHGDLVSQVIETARCIENKLLGSRVTEADQELVGIADISARTHIHRETIRTWTNGNRGSGDFPLQAGTLGGGSRGPMRVWRWAEVNDWLDRNYSLGDGYSYATQPEYARINAYLAHAEYGLIAELQNAPVRYSSVGYAQDLSPESAGCIFVGIENAARLAPSFNSIVIEANK